MADNRLTKKRLKNHFAYNWWKYALSAAVSAMLVSIVFAVTAYRPPAEKKVELYVLNGYIDTETFQRDFWPELQARKPEQEELTVLNINLTDSSNIYAPMQFSTYVAAQQGDLFLISRDEMRRITADGAQEALVELTGAIAGVKYFLVPNVKNFSWMTVVAAMGQMFFRCRLPWVS